jgi:hypothetical protein
VERPVSTGGAVLPIAPQRTIHRAYPSPTSDKGHVRDTDCRLSERQAAVQATVRSYREAMLDFAQQCNIEVWAARLLATELEQRMSGGADRQTHTVVKKAIHKALRHDNMRAVGRLRFISSPPLVVPVEELLGQQERERYMSGSSACSWSNASDPLLLQLKEATRSVLEPYAGLSRYESQGRRVVEGQRFMQAASDSLLGCHRLNALDGQTSFTDQLASDQV